MAKEYCGIDSIEDRIERIRRLISAAYTFCTLVDLSKKTPGCTQLDPNLDDGFEKLRVALQNASEALNGTRDED